MSIIVLFTDFVPTVLNQSSTIYQKPTNKQLCVGKITSSRHSILDLALLHCTRGVANLQKKNIITYVAHYIAIY